MKAVGAFLPAASESTLEIPLQITRIANQNNATISAQNAEIIFHRFFLIFSSTSMPPIFFGSIGDSLLFSRFGSLERAHIDPIRSIYNIPYLSIFTTLYNAMKYIYLLWTAKNTPFLWCLELYQREGVFYEARAENYLFASKDAGCCRMCGSGFSHVLGIRESQSSGGCVHRTAAAYLLCAEGL